MSSPLEKLATVEEALTKQLQGPWTHVRFRRASDRKGFVLLNLHIRYVQTVCTKLFLHGCKQLSDPVLDQSGQFVALHFAANNQVAGILALLFPCPMPADQLVIGKSGKLLSGMAAGLAVEPYRQTVAAQAIDA